MRIIVEDEAHDNSLQEGASSGTEAEEPRS